MPDPLDLRGTPGAKAYEIVDPIAYEAFTPPDAHTGFLMKMEREKVAGYGTWEDTNKQEPTWDDEKKEFISPSAEVTEKKILPCETRAVWIVHGMGQQIPFETLDGLTNGLLGAVQRAGQLRAKPRLRTVKINDQTLQRVELDVKGASRRDYELHLYESYWAPKTEGVAKLKDVVSFLWDGGTRGLLNCMKEFCRAMFGGMEAFHTHWTTPFYICVALGVLLALTLINAVILAAGARTSHVLGIAGASGGHWEQLAALASCMTAVAFTFGTILFLAEMSKPGKLHRAMNSVLTAFSWIALAITVFTILKTAFLMTIIMRLDWLGDATKVSYPKLAGCVMSLADHMPRGLLQGFATMIILSCIALVIVAMLWRAVLRSSEKALHHPVLLTLFFLSFFLHLASIVGIVWIWKNQRAPLFSTLINSLSSSLWVWPFLIVLSSKIRTLMIQYVGDVAIYVQSNKLDRFDEVRTKIKDAARKVLCAIFLARTPGAEAFVYENVAIVGHSLGSVIAYDTLNRLMLDDWLVSRTLQIAKRTNSLLTFGSPLDKTAFFFTIQGKDELRVRERLAATVQPLIQSYYKFRTLRWINVYSRNDIISGKLVFYDLNRMQKPREVPPFAVHNVIDNDAAIPLVAHVDYWKNETVWNELFQQIAP
jgi:hypothetical protein